MAGARGVEELFVIGGREVYREFIPCVDRVYLTVLDGLRFDFFDIAPARFPFGLPELEARFTGHDRISLHGDQPATLHIFRGRK